MTEKCFIVLDCLTTQILQPMFLSKYAVAIVRFQQGSGCGAVGRAVASATRGPGFDSSHRQLLLSSYLLLTVCRKDKNKEKETGNGPFKKKDCSSVIYLNLTAIIALKHGPLFTHNHNFWPRFSSFSPFQYSWLYILPMADFELQTSGVGSDSFTT